MFFVEVPDTYPRACQLADEAPPKAVGYQFAVTPEFVIHT